LMRQFSILAFSISAATRQARGIEKDGVDYYFLSMEDFKQKIQHNEFVEWEYR
jgi:guanylate kinase